MSEEHGAARIEVDLRAGRFSITAAPQDVDHIFDRLEGVLDRYWPVSSSDNGREAGAFGPEDTEEVGAGAAGRTRRAGAARRPVQRPLELGLDESQRAAVRAFFDEKKPVGQEEEVAVLCVRVKELTGKDCFTPDEIASALLLVGRPAPRDLERVVARLKERGRGERRSGKLVVTDGTEDFVRHLVGRPVPNSAAVVGAWPGGIV